MSSGVKETDALVLAQVRNDVLSGRAREIRECSGLSQAEMAEAIGTARSTVALWETHLRRPHGDAAIRYGKFLATLAVGDDGPAQYRNAAPAPHSPPAPNGTTTHRQAELRARALELALKADGCPNCAENLYDIADEFLAYINGTRS